MAAIQGIHRPIVANSTNIGDLPTNLEISSMTDIQTGA